jgi:hypothetical protein
MVLAKPSGFFAGKSPQSRDAPLGLLPGLSDPGSGKPPDLPIMKEDKDQEGKGRMAIIKGANLKQDQPVDSAPEHSIYVSNSKIDKNGVAWVRKMLWLRQDYVNKLKMIAHFQGKEIEQLIDSSLGELVNRVWDNTIAREELVGKATDKVKVPKNPKA